MLSMKQNPIKAMRPGKRAVLFALLVCIPIIALATCQQCSWANSFVVCDSARNCANGGAYKYVYIPEYRSCYEEGADFECFQNTETTEVRWQRFTPKPFDSSQCPDCDWSPHPEMIYNVYECWTNDTECGANG